MSAPDSDIADDALLGAAGAADIAANVMGFITPVGAFAKLAGFFTGHTDAAGKTTFAADEYARQTAGGNAAKQAELQTAARAKDAGGAVVLQAAKNTARDVVNKAGGVVKGLGRWLPWIGGAAVLVGAGVVAYQVTR